MSHIRNPFKGLQNPAEALLCALSVMPSSGVIRVGKQSLEEEEEAVCVAGGGGGGSVCCRRRRRRQCVLQEEEEECRGSACCRYTYIYVYRRRSNAEAAFRRRTSHWRYYGVPTISRLLKITRLFCRIGVSFIGLFCKRDL